MPNSAAPFDVIYLATSDYAGVDNKGNLTSVGMHNGLVYVRKDIPTLPPWYISMVLKPLEREFDFKINLDAPDGTRVFRLNGTYTLETAVRDHSRMVALLQTPPLPFPGTGRYQVAILDRDDKTVAERILVVETGPRPREKSKIAMTAEVDPRFKIKAVRG